MTPAGAFSAASPRTETRRCSRRTRATTRSRRCSCAFCAAPAPAGSPVSSRRARSSARSSRSTAPRSLGTRRSAASSGSRIRRTHSRRYLRNRVRHDLLPALRRANPLIVDELLDVARRAAEVRAQVDVRVTELLGARARGAAAARALDVPASALAGRRTQELALLWPAIAAHVGLALDRRGTARLADFSVNARVGSRVQVSGGWEVARGRSVFQLRTWALVSPPAVLERGGIVRWGRWLFRSASPGEQGARDGARDGGERDAVWSILIPSRGHMSVRGWLAGDTMQVAADGTPRRVKRLLSAAGVTGRDRVGWPVVLLDDAIVWIPGVRRANITAPRGEAGLALRCEQLNR